MNESKKEKLDQFTTKKIEFCSHEDNELNSNLTAS
jgi:hypothetical protein